ncbi:extracellular solute-binding protein [Cellulosimicrobium cellulans]|uniref:extracellular solute-binding protein n=1 Tax=Cellulosimicrobium cellulans TaxID=1710 RepID=UPI0024058C49|nr:extracellular solute-binding protein [Cellulosimicrobium cellulans]MDF9875692.1 N,N'-diacetylchitobiose transport system substrate-binding protein [Cellulosimicrobium cellulans]
MKRNRLVVASVASTITLALALTACSTGGGSDDTGSDEAATGDIRVWLNGSDTPDAAREYLKTTFEEENPGSTLTIEEQSWTGLVDKLTTSLSGSDSPDVVEVGNTQSPAFTSAGFFREITEEEFQSFGGDDLLQGFVEAGDWDEKHYALPYYAGSRAVFYSPSAIGSEITVPTTLDEYVTLGKSLKTDTRSGVYWPGQDWYNALPFVWENGGFIAEQNDSGEWEAGFSSEGGLAGLAQVQDLMLNASLAPKDGQETDLQVPFCEGNVAFLSAPTWIQWSINAPEEPETPDGVPGCASTYGADLTAFPLPGKEAGTTAQVFAGGSNIAVAQKSNNPELAFKAFEIMMSDEYQTILAENGLIPARVSLSSAVPQDNPIAQAGVAAAANTRLTPPSPKWADVEAQNVLQTAFTRIANGDDVKTVAADLDAKIEEILNS